VKQADRRDARVRFSGLSVFSVKQA